MVEIRFHGRGGQGTVIAGKILADAVSKEDKYVQAFPQFGVERRGAPVFAFIRIDDKPIYIRSKIVMPQHVIVVDPSLIDAIDVTEGLKKGGFILINSGRKPSEFSHLGKDYRVFTVDANEIAIKHRLGSKAAPIVNTAILGAVPRIFDFVKLASILQSVREGVPVNPDENAAAAQEAYDSVQGV
ncbi:MAG: 2-oxoacid:acceptor oxidoreductase family protein [Candidatus Aminicenantes bacterium]|nr:2-oxoacid:acceptor oxidoreductase family protein [Candidatus Aminicenantes bacterium]